MIQSFNDYASLDVMVGLEPSCVGPNLLVSAYPFGREKGHFHER